MVFWNESSDCCSWEGVTCDWSNGHVIGLDLSCSHLQGTIQPNTTLFHLRHLQTLNLAFNDFNFSTISPDFGSFPSLTHLNLSSSNFTGRIPSKICHLSKLISLDLSYLGYYYYAPQLGGLYLYENNLNGQIPDSLGNMSQLTNLYLSGNNLSGQIPDALGNMSQLTNLVLFVNNLNGQIPDSLGNMSQLTLLDLSGNNLNGQIPDSLGNMSQLTLLVLSRNNLNGQIPDSLGNMSQLPLLDLFGNNLNGQIPDSLGNMSQLTSLDLNSLQNLNLSHNFITSLECLPWKNLQFIDLHSNSLRGPLPIPPNTTYVFSISNNKLTGEIPTLICNLSSLGVSWSHRHLQDQRQTSFS
ncbi:hypothetical protein ACSBR2_012440 [Camellia fascicularis]